MIGRSGLTTMLASVAGLILVAALAGSLALAARAEALVYWTDSGTGNDARSGAIGRALLDGTGVNPNFIRIDDHYYDRPCGVAVDGAHVYWANYWDNQNDLGASIGRANLDGSRVEENFIPVPTDGGGPCGVAVDRQHIYWANEGFGGPIGRANLDGSGVDQDFITTDYPCGVAVDGAHLYWNSYFNDGGAVRRANLDGSGVEEDFIPRDGFNWACGVAVDSGHLYWGNQLAESFESAPDSSIGRAGLDGSPVDQSFIPLDDGPHPLGGGDTSPCGVAVDGAHVYWGGHSIGRADLDGPGVDENFIPDQSNMNPFDPGLCGVAVDALSTPPPAFNDFTFGKVQKNKRKGRATLTVNVPRPGELTASGDGVKAASEAETSKAVTTPGAAQLLIKATGKKKRKLNKTGKVKLDVAVTYTPTGGDPRTQSIKVKLKTKL